MKVFAKIEIIEEVVRVFSADNKLDQGTLGMSDPLQLTFDQLGTDRIS